ncbi:MULTISPECIES: hypothetical protein [unclassified Paenibacillus]|uniref:hypothetical protein n=1 Tax=unclassified Paenibacillus TaxID=185978 RepID=UPI002474BE33|nr:MULTISPECIES: hypothetical protein [unclassified Paenibacillus]MDH6430285.1 peptidoglycan hydrolase CwlO-like protein [Paenibacillus sp. PastH-4]MDH6446500.1 peptidoglycan hydrolase CwlO-like protein [Paenibacillus sp. PastF-4]MDH6530034.1 peptidoglycan hydrolase CwlO-like protein [Paenibacillus sp. PastH-3]
MKKFVSGVIVGVLLFAGASVFADSASLIGKKVQGLYTIEKSGKKVADAIIIDGSAYAPVRAVAEVTGAGLSVEGKKIIMSTEDSQISSDNKEVEVSRLNIKIDLINKQIQTYQDSIVDIQGKIAKEQENKDSVTMEGSKEIFQLIIDDYKKQITSAQAKIDAANKEITALQAQVTALEK